MPRTVLQGPTIVNGAFRAFTEIHNEVIWWSRAKLSAAIPSSASSPFLCLRVPDAFHHSFVHDPIPEWLSTLWLLSYFHKWKWLGGKWTERTAGVDEEKGRRSSTWKDSTNLFALSATTRLKGSSSRSLVKSATYPMILSSAEVIHDRERQTKYSFPVTRSICFFKFVNSITCNVKWTILRKTKLIFVPFIFTYVDIKHTCTEWFLNFSLSLSLCLCLKIH